MDGNNVKKYDENGQLNCGIYSSPAAARLLLQMLGRRSLDNIRKQLEKIYNSIFLARNFFFLQIEAHNYINNPYHAAG